MTQKLIVIDACMRDGESRTKKIGNDIHVVPVNYFIRIDQRRKTALHSEVRSFCKM